MNDYIQEIQMLKRQLALKERELQRLLTIQREQEAEIERLTYRPGSTELANA